MTAATFTFNGAPVALNTEGFLATPADWSPELAAAWAAFDAHPPFEERHRRVIEYIRGYWTQYGVAPMIRKLCRETGVGLNDVFELFPEGPARGACRYAGLPNPTGCH
jgi:dissimilatory sulfite reductase related protein